MKHDPGRTMGDLDRWVRFVCLTNSSCGTTQLEYILYPALSHLMAIFPSGSNGASSKYSKSFHMPSPGISRIYRKLFFIFDSENFSFWNYFTKLVCVVGVTCPVVRSFGCVPTTKERNRVTVLSRDLAVTATGQQLVIEYDIPVRKRIMAHSHLADLHVKQRPKDKMKRLARPKTGTCEKINIQSLDLFREFFLLRMCVEIKIFIRIFQRKMPNI